MPKLLPETVNLTEAVTVRMDPATLRALDAVRGENGRGAQIRLFLQATLDTAPVQPRRLRRIFPGERTRQRGEVAGIVTALGRAIGALIMAAKSLRLARQRPDLHAEVEGLIVEFKGLRDRIDDLLAGDDRA